MPIPGLRSFVACPGLGYVAPWGQNTDRRGPPRAAPECMFRQPEVHVSATGSACFGNRKCMFRQPEVHVSATGSACFGNRECMFRQPGVHVSATRSACFGNQKCMFRQPGVHVSTTRETRWAKRDGRNAMGETRCDCKSMLRRRDHAGCALY